MTHRRVAAVGGFVGITFIAGIVSFFWQTAGVLAHCREAFLLDVGVFVDAGQAILDHAPLYGDDFPSRSGFAFIYPPLAGVLFVPLTHMDEETMELVWTWASLAAAWLVLTMASHRIAVTMERTPRRGFRWSWLTPLAGLAALGFALLIEPLQVHLMYGQINIFLVLLVAIDLLGYSPKWARGVGIGIAAGIKITPAAYALYFLVTKRWADLGRSLVAFLVTVLLGFAFRASDSWFFWTEEFFNGERGGGPGYRSNQALTGLLTRSGVDSDLAQAIMVPGLVIIAVIAGWAVLRLSRAGRPVSVLLTLVLAVSISAPIAVTHHWVGIIVAVVLLASQIIALLAGRRDQWNWPIFIGTLVLVLANLSFGRLDDANYESSMNHHYMVFLENGPWSFRLADALYGNIQGIAGILCLALLCLAAWRATPAPGRVDKESEKMTDA